MGDRDIEPNIVERQAAEYVRRSIDRRDRDLRERSPEEIGAIAGVGRRAVLWASTAGLVSGALIGGTEILFMRDILEGQVDPGWREQVPYWAAFLALAGGISLVEILFLYWSGLRATARVSRLAGLALGGDDAPPGVVTRGLGRAALELPNPHAPVYGIDPFARTARWKIYAWMLVYRAKVGVSSLVARVLLRRILGRAALRFFIPLVAGPLYAGWNAIITWRIMQEVRLRAFGPLAVETAAAQLAADLDGAGREDRSLAVAAVGEVIIRSRDDHPNFVLLVGRLLEVLALSPSEIDVDWPSRRGELAGLGERERQAVLKALILSSLLDGRVRRSEREVLEDAHGRCGLAFREEGFVRLRERLLEGRVPRPEDFERVWA